MTRYTTYTTITGEIYRHRCAKPGPKPLPEHLRRPCRAFASISKQLRQRLNDEITDYQSESDIITEALECLFELKDQERVLYGLLHSNPVKS